MSIGDFRGPAWSVAKSVHDERVITMLVIFPHASGAEKRFCRSLDSLAARHDGPYRQRRRIWPSWPIPQPITEIHGGDAFLAMLDGQSWCNGSMEARRSSDCGYRRQYR